VRRLTGAAGDRRALYWAFLVATSVAIFYFNTRPQVVRTASDLLNRVIWEGGHLASHAVLGAAAWLAGTATWGHPRGVRVGVAIAVVHSFLDEAVQALVPTRKVDPLDVAMNLIGVALATWGMEWWRQRRRSLVEPPQDRVLERSHTEHRD
jgi:VanZ family protein